MGRRSQHLRDATVEALYHAVGLRLGGFDEAVFDPAVSKLELHAGSPASYVHFFEAKCSSLTIYESMDYGIVESIGMAGFRLAPGKLVATIVVDLQIGSL